MTLTEFIDELESNLTSKSLKLPCFLCNEFGTTRVYFKTAKIDNNHKVIVFIGSLKKSDQVETSKLYNACKSNLAKCANYKIGISTDSKQSLNGKFNIVDQATSVECTGKTCTVYFDDEGVINSIYDK